MASDHDETILREITYPDFFLQILGLGFWDAEITALGNEKKNCETLAGTSSKHLR